MKKHIRMKLIDKVELLSISLQAQKTSRIIFDRRDVASILHIMRCLLRECPQCKGTQRFRRPFSTLYEDCDMCNGQGTLYTEGGNNA